MRRGSENRRDGFAGVDRAVVMDQRSTWRTEFVGERRSYAGGGERHMRK